MVDAYRTAKIAAAVAKLPDLATLIAPGERIKNGFSDCLPPGRGGFGRSYSLTTEGRLVAENGRYERSPLARRRKVKAWFKEKGAELAGMGAAAYPETNNAEQSYLIRVYEPGC